MKEKKEIPETAAKVKHSSQSTKIRGDEDTFLKSAASNKGA